MSLNTKKILGIIVTISSREEILEEIQKYLVSEVKKPFVIATPNPEQVVLSRHNTPFREILNRADVALPDGIGIALAAGVARVPGVEFMEDLVQFAQARSVGIGLIGGYHGLAVRALECLREKYPKLRGWAEDGPEIRGDGEHVASSLGEAYWSTLAEKIRATKTPIIFVGLGAPKQEFFTARLARQFPISSYKFPIILMSVGGSFDLLAGSLKRAPLFIRLIGFEWFWRLLQQPWRWKRQLALIQFVLFLVKARFR